MRIEWKRKLIMAGITVGVFVGYKYLLPAVIPFLVSWLLAVWLEPLARKIEEKTRIKKSYTGAFLLLLVLTLTGTLLYLGIRELLKQLQMAVMHAPELAERGLGVLDHCCGALEECTGILREDSRAYVLKQMGHVKDNVMAFAGNDMAAAIFSWVKGVVFFMSGLVVTVISTLLILGDMDNLRRHVWDYPWMLHGRRIVKRLQKTTVLYLKAQMIIIVFVGGVCCVGFWIMGSPYYLLLGIVLAVLDAFPLIGTGTFLYPAAVFFLIKGRLEVSVGCVILDFITSFLREALEPRILGKKLGISPIVVLASVYLGVLMYGVGGVILGPLSISTIYEIGIELDLWD